MRSPLLPIFLTVFVDVLGLTLILPLLPYYAEHFGASPFVVGTLAASYALCQLVSGPVLGRASDHFGRKPVLLVSQLGSFAAFLMLGSAHALWMLFVGRMIDGMTAGNLTIAQAYISDVTKPEDRTKSFALIGIAFGVGFLLGPAISGVLARRFGYGAPAFGAAGLSFLSIVFTATLLPNVAPTARAGRSLRLGEFLARPHPRRRLLGFFLFILTFSTQMGGLALFLERRYGFDVEKTGYVFAYAGVVGAACQGVIGRLARRLGEVRLALLGFASMALGYAFVGFTHSIPTLGVCATVAGFGAAVTRPALTTLLTRSVDRSEQGLILGASQSLASIAQIAGPLVAGTIIEAKLLWAYGVAGAVPSVLGALFLARESGSDVDPAPES